MSVQHSGSVELFWDWSVFSDVPECSAINRHRNATGKDFLASLDYLFVVIHML